MKALVFLAALILGCGCSTGNRCITVKGEYLGADGFFEYCWSRIDTERFGDMTFHRRDGKKVIVITEDEAQIINEKIRENGHAGAKSLRHPFFDLKAYAKK